MTKVSIIVPLYNQEKYVKQCLDSIQNQTLKDFECIIVNDGSTDRSLEIAQKYQKRDSRFKVIDKENEGYGKTMNVGMDTAIGEYIGITEPDDWIDPEMYETLYNKAKELDLDMIKSDSWNEFQNGTTKYCHLVRQHKEYYNLCINKNICPDCFNFKVHNWTGLYKRQFLIDYNIKHCETPGAAYQDTGFWAQTTYWANKFMVIPQAFYHYRLDNPQNSMCSQGKVFALPSDWYFIQQKLNLNLQDTEDISIRHLWNKHYWDSLWGFKRAQGLKMKLASLFKFAQDFKNCPITQIGLKNKEMEKLKLLINDPVSFYVTKTKSGQAAEAIVSKIDD